MCVIDGVVIVEGEGAGYTTSVGPVTKPARSTQPCIPPGSLNRVPALIDWSKGGTVTSAGWLVTLCDPMACEFL